MCQAATTSAQPLWPRGSGSVDLLAYLATVRVPWYALGGDRRGAATAALDPLIAAREHPRSTPAIASWLATTEATICADRGDHTAVRQALDRAQTALDQPGSRPAPRSFHYHGSAQLTTVTGHILLRAGDHSHACEYSPQRSPILA